MPVKRSKAMTAQQLLEWHQLEKGDMIQFDVPEGFLKKHHWAIYIGENQIIHLTAMEGDGKKESKNAATIFQHELTEYAKNRTVRVNNWADEGYSIKHWFWQSATVRKPDVNTPDAIVEKAKHYKEYPCEIGQYHLLASNCEQFCTLCRYNEAFSGQSIAFGRGWGGLFG